MWCVVALVVASSSDATHQLIKVLLHLLRRNLVQAGGVVCNDGGQVGRIPLGGVHDLVQAPHLPGGQLHGGSEDVVFVAGPDEGGEGDIRSAEERADSSNGCRDSSASSVAFWALYLL